MDSTQASATGHAGRFDAAADDRAARVARAAAAIRARAPLAPAWGVIAGSGLSGLADRLTEPASIAYADIPGWPPSTVAGHAGRLAIGMLAGRPTAVLAGRAHLYEGHPPFDTAFNVRVLAALGVRAVVVTNAAGGMAPEHRPGDVMVIADHIFLPGMAGASPLVGPNDDAVGPRFPGLAGAYDPALQARARAACAAAGFRAHVGVYAMLAGPSFETPAELRFLRAAGADAVGMSTAPEVVVARHAGLRVLGLSLITNVVRFDPPSPDEAGSTTAPHLALHEEVLAVGAASADRLADVIEAVVGVGLG